VSLREVRIDDRTWTEGSEPRRAEWTSAMRELTESTDVLFRSEAHHLHVTVTEQGFLLSLRDGTGTMLADVSLPHDALAAHITEYVDIVRQMAKEAEPTRLEALDMAKKVVHDRAGRTVRRACRDFGVDHATARRLYTLLLTLRVDTTRLIGVHGHRVLR
jgi:uncharacterized protein (UPF0262 family)